MFTHAAADHQPTLHHVWPHRAGMSLPYIKFIFPCFVCGQSFNEFYSWWWSILVMWLLPSNDTSCNDLGSLSGSRRGWVQPSVWQCMTMYVFSCREPWLSWLYMIDAYMHHTTFSLWCHFRQCPWDLSALGRPFLSSFARMGLEISLLAM